MSMVGSGRMDVAKSAKWPRHVIKKRRKGKNRLGTPFNVFLCAEVKMTNDGLEELSTCTTQQTQAGLSVGPTLRFRLN